MALPRAKLLRTGRPVSGNKNIPDCRDHKKRITEFSGEKSTNRLTRGGGGVGKFKKHPKGRKKVPFHKPQGGSTTAYDCKTVSYHHYELTDESRQAFFPGNSKIQTKNENCFQAMPLLAFRAVIPL
jgi:hypothetical protein